jgi:guanylate kinase
MSSNNQSYYLFVLVAASAVGKSVLVNKMCEEGLWQKASKYSTRDYRGIDDDVVKIDEESIKSVENPEEKSKIRAARMKQLIEICGCGKGKVYYKNGNIYGVSIMEIVEGLKSSHLSIILSDFKVIEELKKDIRLQGRIKVMYLASTIDERELLKRYKEREKTEFPDANKTIKTINQIQNMSSILLSAGRLKYLTKIEETLPLLNEEWNQYVPYFDTIKTRATNIRMLYNRYIDNIALIDYVILNFYDLEYIYKQARNILNNIQSKRDIINPPIFMVCAANSSGKATLMEIVGDIGAVHENIVVTTKYAKRDNRPTDGRDGMIAIGRNEKFKDFMENKVNCTIEEKDIWEWGFKQRPTKYAVCHKEISNNLKDKKAQIFISNMGEIENARRFYANNIVVLYLHATHATETKKHITSKRKFELEEEIKNQHNTYSAEDIKYEFENNMIVQERFNKIVATDEKEIEEVHNDFCDHNINIDHVLLNTGTREDLIEQMTNLINYYSTN